MPASLEGADNSTEFADPTSTRNQTKRTARPTDLSKIRAASDRFAGRSRETRNPLGDPASCRSKPLRQRRRAQKPPEPPLS